MEREILFRGKKPLSGEWVEGYFSKFYSNADVVPNYMIFAIDEQGKNSEPYNVDPETVCQYTGTPDKNRRKIFERDIVRRKLFEEYIIGEVVWQDIGVCGFYLKCGNKYYPIGKDEYVEMSSCDEVIGNIFDNPELLKGDSK